MEKILQNGKLVALKISSMVDGSVPVTSPEDALQIVTLKHPKGASVAPHAHIPHKRETEILQECLVVIRGKIRITFYDEDVKPFAHLDVSEGEACITLSGPHGVEFLEDSEVIEVKNGPFFNDKRVL
jgi:cupin fold WbuC family metalloprotein